MMIKALDALSGKIEVDSLTSYKLVYADGKESRIGDHCYIESINQSTVLYSEDAAFQYKVIRQLTEFSDPLGYLLHSPSEFYVGSRGEFYKTISDLILGNILASNGISFVLTERYAGEVDRVYYLKSSFHLVDSGVLLHLRPHRFNDDVRIEIFCGFDKRNPFMSKSRYDKLYHFDPASKLNLNGLVDILWKCLAERGVVIDPGTLHLDNLQRVWQDNSITMQIEMRKLGLVHEVIDAGR